MFSVPRIEGPVQKGIDGVGPMQLRDGKEEINGITPIPLVNRLDISTTFDETLGNYMV
jgi:hypothetical protein